MKFTTFILLFIYANISLALGLGDAELKSHLGEKLVVKVNITEMEAAADSACFSISDASDVPAFKKPNIAFKQVNDNYQLLISSKETITEPIITLRVAAHCENNVSRDYVLLLDPAPLISIVDESSNIAGQDTIQLKKSDAPDTPLLSHKLASKKTLGADLAADKIRAPSKSAQKLANPMNSSQKAKKALIKTPSVDERLNTAYTGKPQQALPELNDKSTESRNKPLNATRTKPTANKTASDKPYLVISGDNDSVTAGANKPSLSLRLETQLDMNRVEAAPTPPNAEDTLDEITVMANRMAYLEKQITSLQTRNTQLVTDAEKSKNDGFSFASLQTKWGDYLLAALGLALALIAALWLSRKIASNRLDKEQDNWFDTDTTDLNAETTALPVQERMPAQQPIMFGADNHQISETNQKPESANKHKVIEENNDEHESILENAEVFIAHDRPALAIQLLQNYLTDVPAESPAIWLKLLSLLATEGDESEYDSTVLECKKFFNIKMPNYAGAAILDTSSLEEYPHIIARLEGVWGSQFALGFLNDLIYNKKSQPREGFERNTFDELFFLKQIAAYLNPTSDTSHEHGFYHADELHPMFEKASVKEAAIVDSRPLIQHETNSKQTLNNNEIEFEHADNSAHAPEENSNAGNIETMSLAPLDIPHQETTLETEPLPATEILLNAEKTLSLHEGLDFTAAELSISLQTDEKQSEPSSNMFNADEIDFSSPIYEIDFDSVPVINLLDEEMTVESEPFSVIESEKNLEQAIFKKKPAAKSKAKKQAQKNVIEWDVPTETSADDARDDTK